MTKERAKLAFDAPEEIPPPAVDKAAIKAAAQTLGLRETPREPATAPPTSVRRTTAAASPAQDGPCSSIRDPAPRRHLTADYRLRRPLRIDDGRGNRARDRCVGKAGKPIVSG